MEEGQIGAVAKARQDYERSTKTVIPEMTLRAKAITDHVMAPATGQPGEGLSILQRSPMEPSI
jgi:hypothetical protein